MEELKQKLEDLIRLNKDKNQVDELNKALKEKENEVENLKNKVQLTMSGSMLKDLAVEDLERAQEEFEKMKEDKKKQQKELNENFESNKKSVVSKIEEEMGKYKRKSEFDAIKSRKTAYERMVENAKQTVAKIINEFNEGKHIDQSMLETAREEIETNQRKVAETEKELDDFSKKYIILESHVEEYTDLVYLKTRMQGMQLEQLNENTEKAFYEQYFEKEKTDTEKETAEKETAEKETAEKETAEKETAEKETAEKETAEKETAEKETAEKETAEKETAEKETAEKETAEKETAEKETAEKKTAEKETAEKETAEKETAEKETAEKKTAEKETAEKETAEKEAVGKEETAGKEKTEKDIPLDIMISAKDNKVYLNGEPIDIDIEEVIADKDYLKDFAIEEWIPKGKEEGYEIVDYSIDDFIKEEAEGFIPFQKFNVKRKLDPVIIAVMAKYGDTNMIRDYIGSVADKKLREYKRGFNISYDLRESKFDEMTEKKMQKKARHAKKIGIPVEGLKSRGAIAFFKNFMNRVTRLKIGDGKENEVASDKYRKMNKEEKALAEEMAQGREVAREKAKQEQINDANRQEVIKRYGEEEKIDFGKAWREAQHVDVKPIEIKLKDETEVVIPEQGREPGEE